MTIIRCRAGAGVGLGHLVRCRVLAKILKQYGETVYMVGPPTGLKTPDDDRLFADWIEREDWESAESEAKFHIDLALQTGSESLVLDDYRSDGQHQLLVRRHGLVALQQYDASKPQTFASDFVVNASPAEKRETYEAGFLYSDIETLMGPRYSILRPEFSNLEHRPAGRPVQRILITFGGGDDRGAVRKVLSAFRDKIEQDQTLVVMLGQLNPNIADIEDVARDYRRSAIEIHVNPEDPFSLINSCDLAILSGGTTTFEAAFCGIPMILMPIAENQVKQGQGWQELGAAIYLGRDQEVSAQILASAVTDLVCKTEKLESMSLAGRNMVDGAGGQRLVKALLQRPDQMKANQL